MAVLSRIYTDFGDALNNDIPLKAAWSIIKNWDENTRYLTGKTENDVKDLLTSIKKFTRNLQDGYKITYKKTSRCLLC